ncbi:acyl-CoA thioesterase [Microbacterium testaceum]|uniref:hydroxyphenylacetyl-CoA thioesterase PaaI n=1 Tax=Microbacterium testaceum TaxID=2033 RepID=UPI00278098A9|nr:hydroxyphenylacetyl-CoA thioesterase PaaI [Microbacterium testaceum]MDQ1174599.1 acyl-CoA thioesterase [Microbacterium testaceum]
MMRNDNASRMLGMVVEHDAPGESRVSMTVRDDMLNGFAITHGGLVFTLADTAFAIACNEDERVTVAGGADITFLKSTIAGQTLTATAARRARSGRTGLYDIRVTDETGDLVAEVRGRSITTDRRPPAPVAEPVEAAGVQQAPVPSTGSGTSVSPVAEPVEASGVQQAPVPSTGSGTSISRGSEASPVAEPVEAAGDQRGPVPSTGSGTSDGSGTSTTNPAPERDEALTTTEVSR